METQEMKIAIAKFMGEKFSKNYDTDWSAIMPVIERICTMEDYKFALEIAFDGSYHIVRNNMVFSIVASRSYAYNTPLIERYFRIAADFANMWEGITKIK